jgi:hypothetical protein
VSERVVVYSTTELGLRANVDQPVRIRHAASANDPRGLGRTVWAGGRAILCCDLWPDSKMCLIATLDKIPSAGTSFFVASPRAQVEYLDEEASAYRAVSFAAFFLQA